MINGDTLTHRVQRKCLVCFFTLLVAVSANVFSLGSGVQAGATLRDLFGTDSGGKWNGNTTGAISFLFWQNWGGHWGINADFTLDAATVGLSLDWLGAAWEISSGHLSGHKHRDRIEVAASDTSASSFTLNWGFGPGLFLQGTIPFEKAISPNIWDIFSVGIRLPVLFFLSFEDDYSKQPLKTVFLQVTPNILTPFSRINRDFKFTEDVLFNTAITVGFILWPKAKQSQSGANPEEREITDSKTRVL